MGRQIEDIIIVANVLLDSRLASEESGLIFKLDFCKAFDTVSWVFIDEMLKKFCFGH